MVTPSLEAADRLAKEGVEVEVIDLRTLLPFDKAAIFASVEKTSRVLIVHEDVKTLGIGAELSAVIMEERFDALDAPVMRVTYPDTHARSRRCSKASTCRTPTRLLTRCGSSPATDCVRARAESTRAESQDQEQFPALRSLLFALSVSLFKPRRERDVCRGDVRRNLQHFVVHRHEGRARRVGVRLGGGFLLLLLLAPPHEAADAPPTDSGILMSPLEADDDRRRLPASSARRFSPRPSSLSTEWRAAEVFPAQRARTHP